MFLPPLLAHNNVQHSDNPPLQDPEEQPDASHGDPAPTDINTTNMSWRKRTREWSQLFMHTFISSCTGEQYNPIQGQWDTVISSVLMTLCSYNVHYITVLLFIHCFVMHYGIMYFPCLHSFPTTDIYQCAFVCMHCGNTVFFMDFCY